jgi:hypothetical protein
MLPVECECEVASIKEEVVCTHVTGFCCPRMRCMYMEHTSMLWLFRQGGEHVHGIHLIGNCNEWNVWMPYCPSCYGNAC